ncbi:hypothetical protein A2U01_0084141, partial [Trifolium medium]|nr:hypothetical protein [Trifolium medium]
MKAENWLAAVNGAARRDGRRKAQ